MGCIALAVAWRATELEPELEVELEPTEPDGPELEPTEPTAEPEQPASVEPQHGEERATRSATSSEGLQPDEKSRIDYRGVT